MEPGGLHVAINKKNPCPYWNQSTWLTGFPDSSEWKCVYIAGQKCQSFLVGLLVVLFQWTNLVDELLETELTRLQPKTREN
jgi:hypothetical protein